MNILFIMDASSTAKEKQKEMLKSTMSTIQLEMRAERTCFLPKKIYDFTHTYAYNASYASYERSLLANLANLTPCGTCGIYMESSVIY